MANVPVKANAKATVQSNAKIATAAKAPAPAPVDSDVNPFTIGPDHLLYFNGKLVKQTPSPNRGGKITPTLLLIHYTAGFTTAGAVSALTNRKMQVSAHLVIGRDGEVVQLVPFNIRAFHAGVSSWKKRSNCNNFSIGIELVNCGPVLVRGDGKLVAEVSASRIIPPSDVVEARHPNGEATKFWQVYPDAQMKVAVDIGQAICERYKITADNVTDHYNVAPRRKRDAGPAFPLSSYVARVTSHK